MAAEEKAPAAHAPLASPSRKSIYQRITAFETALLAGGLALFFLLLYEMHRGAGDGFLNPPLVAAATVILLWPLRKYTEVQAILMAGGFLLVLWFLDRLSGVLLPFIIVYLLAYLFNPLVTTLQERWNVPRSASAGGVTLIVVGLVALFFLLLVPQIVGQLEVLASRLVTAFNGFREWMLTTTILDDLEETGLVDKGELISQLNIFVQEQATGLAESIPDAAQRLVRSISSLLGLVTVLSILPVILYYTLKDYPHITQRLIGLFPTFGGQRDYLVKTSRIVGSYLRGQLIICTIAAVVVSTALVLFGVPFALLIGLMAGVLNLIPSLGIVITYVLGVLLMLIFGDPWFVDAIIVVAVLMGESLLEQSVLTPKVMAHQVGLHPVTILLSLFVFGALMGLLGLVIAVPATALLMTFYKAYRNELTLDLSTYGKRPRPRWLRLGTRTPKSEHEGGETFAVNDAPKSADEALSIGEKEDTTRGEEGGGRRDA